jgi:hypothetical protein
VRDNKDYCSGHIRVQPRRRRIRAHSERTNQQANHTRRGGRGRRPPRFDPDDYQERNTVERHQQAQGDHMRAELPREAPTISSSVGGPRP